MRLTLNGYVVPDEDAAIYRFFGFTCFSPQDVRGALASNPNNEPLTLEINSPGGSVFAGFEMYSVLRSVAGKIATRAEVQSLAASAATTVMVGCDTVELSPVAQVMIHLPSTATEGDTADHAESIKILESITESILNAYVLKCNGRTARAELRSMMEGSAWLTAQEALSAGLADSILYADNDDFFAVNAAAQNSIGSGIRALAASSSALPDAASLRKRYQQLVAEGKAPAAFGSEGNQNSSATGKPPDMCADWRNKARLAICKAKIF